MQHSELAAWLQGHKDALVAVLGEDPFDVPMIESMLETARTGRLERLDSIGGQAARQAILQEQPLDQLLQKLGRLKGVVWRELKQQDLPASQTLALIEAAEPLFSRLAQTATQVYLGVGQQIQDQLASEIARLHSETERRVMGRTADLARANIELSRLEQVRTDFISIAAHELKTPLTLIQGYANMLCELDPKTEEVAGLMHLARGILRGTERLSAIVEDMLDVSVIDTNALSLRIQEVSLSHAVSLTVGQNARTLEERRLAVHVGDLSHLPPVEVDARRLHQILTNLLNNAIRYTPDGGQVFIEGQRLLSQQQRPPSSPVGAEFVEVTFRDTGIGIAPEDRERIFEKFYRVGKSTLHSSGRVKFKGAGPGLGLPIARGLVEAHGGRLWAESPGHDEVNCPGSTFHLLLPVQAIPKAGIQVIWVKSSSDEGDEQQTS